MKKFIHVVSALVLMLGLTATRASFAEFFPPPPIAPMPISPGFMGGGFPMPPSYGYPYGYGYSSSMFAGGSHGGYPPGGGFNPYGMYRHGYGYGGPRGFMGRGGCGSFYRNSHHSCGRGRRSFRSFSLSIGGLFSISTSSGNF